MGLREKIALLIVALSFEQITHVECGFNANNLKFPMKTISKPKRSKWTQSKDPGQPSTVEESFKRSFNFPEVDYPLPPTFISTSYYNPILDYTKNEVIAQPRDSFKNIGQHSIDKKSRKYNGSFKSPKKSFYVTHQDKATMPSCLNGADLFPSVDYPTDASALWNTHYWERIHNTKPEVIQNLNEMASRSKAKLKLSASKAINKNVSKQTLTNSAANTNVTTDHKENRKKTLASRKEQSIHNPISSNGDECSRTSEYALISDRLNTTKECDNDKFHIESDDKSFYNFISQSTPSPINTNEYVTPIPKTATPFSADINNILPAKELRYAPMLGASDCDSSDEPEGIGQEMAADEVACTIYPEVFSSLPTSTMAPIYSNEDISWMDPELDNHTLNTYSDEVEQYYILV